MIKRNQGFILFMTLCIIFIINLLLITCMQQILIYYKAINNQELMHQEFYQLEGQAFKLVHELSILKKDSCIQLNESSQDIIKKLSQPNGCSIRDELRDYKYLVEDLGAYQCLIINQSGRKFSTHHFKISLAILDINKHPVSLLQLRVILPTAVNTCLGLERIVNKGISSWRYLHF